MIAHVAEAGEGSGRVVLQMGPQLSDVAVQAAMQVARSFRSEVEGFYTDGDMLIDLAAFSFAREISIGGAIKGPLDTTALLRRQHRAAAAIARRAAAVAHAAGVPFKSNVRQQDSAAVLAEACAQNGPWNMVALGEPFYAHDAVKLREMFASVWGTTGFVVTGPKARSISGPVVAVIEDAERFAPMLRTADHLAKAIGTSMRVVLVAQGADQVVELESHARIILKDEGYANLPMVTVSHGGAPAIGKALRAAHAGFVVAHYDGLAVPSEGDETLLGENLEGPLLLVR